MKCSAWLSLAISACRGEACLALVLGAAVAALVAAAPAGAHVYASPGYVSGGATSTVTFSVPNERSVAMGALALTVPQGFRIVKVQPAPGWTAQVSGDTATWTGARLPGGATASLEVELQAPTEPGTVSLLAEQRYPDGQVVRWSVSLTVVPASEASQHLGTALVVGIFGLLAITAVAVLLRQRRLRSLQEK
jgi:uncharacterized protein YcnI